MKLYFHNLIKCLLVLLDARVLVFLLPALAYLYYIDAAQANVIVYSFVVVIAAAAVTLVTRKVFFPYVDLEKFAREAKDGNVAGAIVFLSVSLVICMVLYVVASWAARM